MFRASPELVHRSPSCSGLIVVSRNFGRRAEASSLFVAVGAPLIARLGHPNRVVHRSAAPAMASSSSASSPSGDCSQWRFPFLSSPGTRLMEDMAGLIAQELSSSLKPSSTPANVRHFKNDQGTGEGSVTIRAGNPGSKIDFVLGSWLHCNLPFGSLNIATFVGMVNEETDAPHLLFEFIQTGATSLVVVLDLLPRKDLVMDPEYLKRFYEDTAVENVKQNVQKSQLAQRYEPPTLYVRCLTSPTAIMFKFDGQLVSGEPGQVTGLDGAIEEVVYPAAKQVIQIWIEGVLTRGKKVVEGEVHALLERDNMIKTKGVEVDLSSNMPRLFGHEIAERVVQAFRKGE